ncbi:peptide/nickel transport system substrate-binding protein [Actinokineospora alba]|uniref:Peptide/nickel transport system substrate-binding protein n=1 Tax=Actinokineospora alba TaxID=504798 RepID=A0A1H0L6B1_9PSEU|nr:ABC transporter substrate-binding protein [Actinokineospora alba]TDP67213.1 peptide/nickel transport system substrate-binding protein [Actinokineospora alba]SDJ04268.1 peptide/nickel transport system substrate-binding protein [Actinokineospora alba]SDO63576.1 peptide/nickel transport system substrate-binding protein [Actinokineospora alba]
MSKQSRTLRRVGFVAGIAMMLLALAACGGSGDKGNASSLPKAGDTITMSLPGGLTTLDPALGSSAQAAIASWAMYDTLVAIDSDGKVIPGLAKSWKATPTQATFELKDGITCSDGTALTPDDIAASLTRFLDPNTAAPLRGLVTGQGEATVTADDSSVTVKLSQPWTQLVAGLTVPFTGIICPEGLKEPKSLATKSEGTGAWVADSQVSGSSYTFSYHEGYEWGAEYPNQPAGTPPKKLVMSVITDESTMANLLATGEMQVASFASDAWKRFADTPNATIDVKQFYDTFLMFNENDGHPTADPQVRKAISQAIDREQLNNVQSFGAGKVLNNLGQPNYECYDDSIADIIPATDPEAAKGVLDGVKVRVLGTNILAGGDANNYVLEALRGVGADPELQNLSNEAWIGDLFSGKNDWDVNLYVQGVPFTNMLLTALNFIGPPPPNGQNLGNVQNEEAATALGTYTTTEGEESCAAMSDIQKALIGNNDVLPLASVPYHMVYAGGSAAVAAKGYILPATIRVAG